MSEKCLFNQVHDFEATIVMCGVHRVKNAFSFKLDLVPTRKLGMFCKKCGEVRLLEVVDSSILLGCKNV